MLRRDLFTGGLAALAVTTTGRLAGAQEKYPSRTVRLIVPTAAGGVYDLMGRLFIDRVAASFGTAIVENRAGGNAVVGVMAAALSAPDGYTLLLGSNSTHIFQPAMMRNPPYDPVKQFEVISTLSASWACIAVSPKLGVNTLGELIDYAKKHPIAHGMRGVFFVITGQSGLTDDQIRYLANEGHEIEAHSIHHPDLTTLSDDQLRAELTEPRAALQALTGQPVDFLAYPYGAYNTRVIAATQAAGYRAALAAWGGESWTPAKWWNEPRVEIDGGLTLEQFAGYLE